MRIMFRNAPQKLYEVIAEGRFLGISLRELKDMLDILDKEGEV
jgi:hypothetical protein